ncbi:MAG: bifunctional 3-hydroxydecanoyl-ACP dehydratase/trans-2-decenoyl-ACP isomerase [Geobacteraceae bacterium]|nr:bifunctional 3-hydroxydecanoyl-ACP dehydratase/trans-2-decenoyl-ACP isomerase [Geobacteraceae bacterium]
MKEQIPVTDTSIKSSYTRDEILKCGTGELNGIAYPRLPLPDMLMIDRITRISDEGGRYGNGEVEAEFTVSADTWFFACHFKDDPVMPGSLAVDALCQLLGFYLGWKGYKGKGRALGIGEIKYRGEILPTSGTITYHLDIRKIVKSSIAMACADGQVLLHGHVVHTVKSMRVGIIPY